MTTFTAEQIKYLETKINFLDEGDVKQGFNVKGSVLGSVKGNVLGDVEGDVKGNVLGDVEGSVEGDIWGSVEGNVEDGVRGSILGNVKGNVLGDVEGSIQGSVWGNVEDGVRGNVGNVEGDVLALPKPSVVEWPYCTVCPKVLEEIRQDAGEWAGEAYLQTVEAIALAVVRRIDALSALEDRT